MADSDSDGRAAIGLHVRVAWRFDVDLLDRVLIIGARTDISVALAHDYASEGCALVLAADPSALAEIKADLEVRHQARVTLIACDVTAPDPEPFFASLAEVPGTVIMLAGLLGDQETSMADSVAAERAMATNYNGPARVLLAAARRMQLRGSGELIGISSVAGDRGRASNFIYGSAKAGFTAFLSGLRNALAGHGVHVLTVKPGFVATKMTFGMDLPPRLTAQPSEVAQAVLRAHKAGRDVIYVKPIWHLIMLIVRSIPERLFKRMSM